MPNHGTKPGSSVLVALAALLLVSLAPPALAGDGMDAFVASLEGAWAAQQVETPLGTMPFALLFERRPDGSLAAHTPWDSETFVDVTFTRGSDGRWLLVEHARLPEAGEQRRILVPAGLAGTVHRFADAADPETVAVDLGVEEDALEITVWVHGQRHVHGTLRRLPDEAIPGLRAQLEQMARRPHRALGREESR